MTHSVLLCLDSIPQVVTLKCSLERRDLKLYWFNAWGLSSAPSLVAWSLISIVGDVFTTRDVLLTKQTFWILLNNNGCRKKNPSLFSVLPTSLVPGVGNCMTAGSVLAVGGDFFLWLFLGWKAKVLCAYDITVAQKGTTRWLYIYRQKS